VGLLLAGWFAFTPRPVSAAFDTYLVFVETSQGQIKGESRFPGHEGWIEVESASLGNLALTEENHAALQRATSGAGAGKVTFAPFTIHKSVDSASPLLFRAAQRSEPVVKVIVECASGQHITRHLTITGGTLSARPDGTGKETITFAGGRVTYN
jgi:type VI protein secretion system component Hcp